MKYITKMFASTGLFRVRVNFDTPLISVVDGPILKSFEVVRANAGRFDLVYNNVGNYPLKIWDNLWTNFGPFLCVFSH